jgi:hypothetical protein
MFVGQPLDTLQLDHENVFDEDIGKVFADRKPLIRYG